MTTMGNEYPESYRAINDHKEQSLPSAELRAALCDCVAIALHVPPRHHGHTGKPPPDVGPGRAGHAGDHRAELNPALASL